MKVCEDCGVKLGFMDSSFGTKRCMDCWETPFPRTKRYFEAHKTTESDIKSYPQAKAIRMVSIYTLLLILTVFIASIAGFSRSSMAGLGAGFLGGVAITFLFRKLVVDVDTLHPLDANRWFKYGKYAAIFFLSFWIFAYMGYMPTYGHGSIMTYRVDVAGVGAIPAIFLVMGVGLIGIAIGAVGGFINLSRKESKIKQHLLIHHQRWMNSKNIPPADG